MHSFSNKRALVLGGTSGIGLAVVAALQSAGCAVIAASRRGSGASLPEGVIAEAVDVLDRAALEALFAKHAPLDFLVSAATGGPRPRSPFMQMDLDEFDGAFAKLRGYANAVRLGVPHLREAGAIVLISGTPARRCRPGMLAISCAGAAIEALVRGLAPELAPRRINAVAPGVIDTPMFPGEGAERLAGMIENNPLPRPGRAEEVAEAVLLLLGNEFMTGTVVDVDGGVMAAA